MPACCLTLSYKTHVQICHNYQEKLQICSIQVIQVPSKYHNLTLYYWCFIHTCCCALILYAIYAKSTHHILCIMSSWRHAFRLWHSGYNTAQSYMCLPMFYIASSSLWNTGSHLCDYPQPCKSYIAGDPAMILWFHLETVLALGCKKTYISVENIHTHAIFWTASLQLVWSSELFDSLLSSSYGTCVALTNQN